MNLYLMKTWHRWLKRESDLYCATVTILMKLKRFLLNLLIRIINFFLTKKLEKIMPTKRSEKYSKGLQVYLTVVSEAMHDTGWRTIEEAGEDIHYSIFSNGLYYDNEGAPSLDIVNHPDINDLPNQAQFRRIKVKELILLSEFQSLKKNSFKEPGDPLETGIIVILNTGEEGRIVYAKIMSVEKSMFGDQYEIITTGNNMAHTVRRGDIAMPSDVYSVRDVTIRQQIMEYNEGTEAQVIGSFLYIGGDDILVHEKFAINKKLI